MTTIGNGFNPSSLSGLSADLFHFVTDHFISIFFCMLLFSVILWLIGFKYIFTKDCITDFFHAVGVGNVRTKRALMELRRKSFHLLGLLIPFIYYMGLKYSGWLTQSRASVIVGSLTTFLWIVELLRLVSTDFRNLYNVVFASLLRKSETESPRAFTGTGYFFLGTFLCIALFPPIIGISSMLCLVLGDMTAAIVGISFGYIKIGKKSLEGTLAMFFMCFFIGCVLFWHVPLSEYVIFIGAFSGTMTELLGPKWLDDNLSIPVATGTALTLAFRRLGQEPPPV